VSGVFTLTSFGKLNSFTGKIILMKTQIVLLSMAMLAINSPQTVLRVNSPENASKTMGKPQSTDFAFFITHSQCKAVTAVWGVTSIADIGCFMVQRTSQDPNDLDAFWEDLNYMPSTADRWYRWTDENVPPGSVSYRILAFLYDGTTMSSSVSRVRTGWHAGWH
jgi:hypothetical protein